MGDGGKRLRRSGCGEACLYQGSERQSAAPFREGCLEDSRATGAGGGQHGQDHPALDQAHLHHARPRRRRSTPQGAGHVRGTRPRTIERYWRIHERMKRNEKVPKSVVSYISQNCKIQYAAMSRRTVTSMLAFLLLINTVIYSVLPAGVLSCVGEKCGITLWHCCCEDSPSYKGKCAIHPGTRTVVSAEDCNCVMVLSVSPISDLAPPSAVTSCKPIIFLATLPAPVASYVPLIQGAKSFSRNETRGPPSRWVVRSSNSLRAPPVA